MRSEFATRAYVIGEIFISLVALGGSFIVLFYAETSDVKLVAGSVLSAVTVFWFSRRASEQSNNSIAMLADGKITQLLNEQSQQQVRMDSLMSLVSSLRREQEATKTKE